MQILKNNKLIKEGLCKSEKKRLYPIELVKNDIEHIARSNLCQLSQNICEQLLSRNQIVIHQFSQEECSPWLNSERECLAQAKSKLNKGEKRVDKIQRRQRGLLESNKQNQFAQSFQKREQQDYLIHNYPSIFMRIKVAHHKKKQQKQETEIVTIMMKPKSYQAKNCPDLQRITLSEKIKNHSQNLALFNKSIEDLQVRRAKKSLSNTKSIPYKQIQLFTAQLQNIQRTQKPSAPVEHWKERKIRLKNRIQKQSSKKLRALSLGHSKSRQYKSVFYKKASLSVDKAREQFDSSAPRKFHLFHKQTKGSKLNKHSSQHLYFL